MEAICRQPVTARDPGRIHHGGTEARSKIKGTTSGYRTLGTVSFPPCLRASVVN